MTSQQISNTVNTTFKHLSEGKLKFALDNSKILTEELQIGEITDQWKEISTNYNYLLDYFFMGVEDPQRKTIQNRLYSKLYTLTHLLNEELMMRNSSSFEYGQKRIFRHKLHFSLPNDLWDSIHYSHRQFQLHSENNQINTDETRRIRQNYEKLIPDIFLIFWLTTQFQNSEKTLFNNILGLEQKSAPEKAVMISAITLNLWRMFDPEKIFLLLDACNHSDIQVSQRALVGLCFILYKYNDEIEYFPKIRNRLVLLTDNNSTTEQIKNILLIIIGTVDTDKITKKMTEEILPEMMKISPKIKDKLDEQSLMQSDEWDEENPEWREILEENGLAEKMQELTELQLEGADVYMSTFSILKNFPFFTEISSWFMPFDTEISAVNDLFVHNEKSIASAFVKNSAICNSDKYSFCLSLMQMPPAQRENLTKSFKIESDQIDEITKDELLLNPTNAAKNIAKQYIQDLFRFFRLYPHHKDFVSMFEASLKMHRTKFFDILSSSANTKQEVAEFYFLKNHFSQAIDLFSDLAEKTQASASLYQKLGFAYQNESKLTEATLAYEKADFIQPDDLWTLRKMAFCYKLNGDFKKALHTYQHIDFLKPKKASNLLQIANCYAKLEQYEEALKLFFELDSTEDGQVKIWRQITQISFLSGKYAQSQYYSDKTLEMVPDADDFLIAAYIRWTQNKMDQSLVYFKKAFAFYEDLNLFLERIILDKQMLQSAGISLKEVIFALDKISFDKESSL